MPRKFEGIENRSGLTNAPYEHNTTQRIFDIAEEYIRKLNEIADKQGFSVITAFYRRDSRPSPSTIR